MKDLRSFESFVWLDERMSIDDRMGRLKVSPNQRTLLSSY